MNGDEIARGYCPFCFAWWACCIDGQCSVCRSPLAGFAVLIGHDNTTNSETAVSRLEDTNAESK